MYTLNALHIVDEPAYRNSGAEHSMARVENGVYYDSASSVWLCTRVRT